MEAILDPANIIMVIAGMGAFMTILAFGMPIVARDNFNSRLKAVAQRREQLQASANLKKEETFRTRLRQEQSKNFIRMVVDRFKLLNEGRARAMRDRLAQAGMRGQGPLYTYAFFLFVGPIIAAVVVAFYIFVLARVDWSLTAKLVAIATSALVGWLLPKILLANKIKKRQQVITRAYPDALDLLVICVEAGLSVEAGFNRVAEEFDETSPPLAEEMGLTTAEMAFLPDRKVALNNLFHRTGLPAIKALVTALIQSEQYGTPVAVTLRVQSNEQREERMSRAEKKAGALPAQLTVPMIVFFLPVIFVVILGPAIIQTLRVI